MKNILLVTGGAGFIGSHMIEHLLNKTNLKIISLDNYSTGSKKNHIINSKRIEYIKGDTSDIGYLLKSRRKKIKAIFHFGEFSRIFQSFKKFNDCYKSNSIGTNEVIRFCMENKIKLIYSATSASLGNNGRDKNLSPYAFSKSKNLELLENLKIWFNFRYEIIYFYNVYGKHQIDNGEMATVIGIFQNQYKKKIPLTVVRPGSQTRRFTHVNDTIKVCYEAWKKNKCCHYSISHREAFSIIQVAKMFKTKVIYLPKRLGERYASALINLSYNNKVIKKFGKISLKDYVSSFITSEKNKI